MKNALLFLAVLLSNTIVGQDFSNIEIKSQKISDDIYVLFGSGGNIGVLAGDDGIVLVDDQFAPLSDKIKDALSQIRDQEVTFSINTHFHYDHTDGNKVFGPEGTWIVAHENTRKKLMQDVTIGANDDPHLQEKYPNDALPKITFEKSLKLHLNGQTVYIFHAEKAHTDSDAIIYFQEANVFHTGDVFVRYGIPFIDERNGGSVGGMIKAVNKLIEMCDEETVIIPGHGMVSNKQDVIDYRDMLQEIWSSIDSAISSGSSLKQILDSDPTGKYGETAMAGYFVELIFNEISDN